MKAVVPAAGLGTRLLPYTRAQPKEMIPILEKPALQYVVEEAVEAGLHDILMITGRGKRAIEDHFDPNMDIENRRAPSGTPDALEGLRRILESARILYVRQPIPRGLGDAVAHAEAFVGGEPFGVLLGDDITMNPSCIGMVRRAHESLGASVLAVQRVAPTEMTKYGMVMGQEVSPGVLQVSDVIEKPVPSEVRSPFATIGRYVFTPGIFGSLREVVPGRDAELQLTDAIRALLRKEDVFAIVYPGERYDVGDVAGWLRATLALASRREDLQKVLKSR